MEMLSDLSGSKLKQRRKLVELLMAEGSDYEVKDIQDFRALHYACVWGWSSVVEKLLSMDCDIAPKTTNGATPLMFGKIVTESLSAPVNTHTHISSHLINIIVKCIH